MNKLPLYMTMMVLLLLPACSSEDSGGDAASLEEAADQTPTNRVAIPATVRSNLGITFAPVERRKVEQTIRVPGSFELQPTARHAYRMALPGQVELKVNQYQAVKQGELLYRFRSPQWSTLQREIIESEQAIASAEAEIAVARASIAQGETRLSLVKARLASLAAADVKNAELEAKSKEIQATLPRLHAELQQSETKHANARRTREHALHVASSATGIEAARLSELIDHDGEKRPAYQTIDWIEVHATRHGVVETLAVTDGAYAQVPSLVLSTIDPSQVRFRAMALQSDLTRFSGGAQARIVPPLNPTIALDSSVDAELTVGLEAQPAQRTVTLLATPGEQRDWIRPGVSAFLEVTVESTGGYALAIPRSAVVKDGIVHVFFRRDPADPNKAIRVEADMGVSDGRWVAINSGVMLSDEVVLNGVYELKLATQQSGVGQKGGHFHADGTFHAEDH